MLAKGISGQSLGSMQILLISGVIMSSWKMRGSHWLMALSSGAMLWQLGSCNPNVRDAVLSGLETVSLSFANILISALFDGFGDTGAVGGL